MANKKTTNKKQTMNSGPKRKFHWFKFFTVLLVIAVGIELVLGATGFFALKSLLKDEQELDLDRFYTQETTIIYDRDGNQIADVGAQIRDNITYDEIPEALVDAFLSIEDSRYFTHNGFDIPRFAASIVNTVLHHNMQGGSTFTMQLVKMTYFTDDSTGTSSTKDIEYKVQQIDLAMKLETKASKEEIFEMYMNKMNFGGIGNIRGVEKASEQYFGKRVSQLNISECAMLAGVVNSPYYYNPYTYLDHATERRDTVLYQMLNHGYITEAQYNLATSVRVEDLLCDPADSSPSTGYQYQAYIDYVIHEAEETTGQDPLNVSMEIYTAMDPIVQTATEEIQAGNNANVQFPDDLMEMGSITENNQNGEIIAIGGGRNYAGGGSMLLNHATDQYKQPGSSVKPFLDYAPALDYLGWATDHVLIDKPVTYGTWTYQNAGGDYYGRVNIQYALTLSLNTPAIQTCQAVMDQQGYDWYVQYMEDLGFDKSIAETFDISYSIGGNSFLTTPEEMMAAHATIMNGGNYITPHTIRKITYRDGLQPDVEPTYTAKSVMSPQAAYLTAQLMYGCVHDSAAYFLRSLRRNYATYGKTGTTDWGDSGIEYGIPEGAMKDKWMISETSQYTTALWLGWEKAVPGEATYFTTEISNMNIPGAICSEILDATTESNGIPDPIAQPSGISSITHVSGIFPYVAATEQIPEEYVTTGLIKSDFAGLGSFNSAIPALSNLSSFTASANGVSSINLSWATYPDPSKLTVADKEKTLFDISWVTGPVVYKARVSQNGQTLGELSSESDKSTQNISLAYDTETKVCGYYGYSTSGDMSNEVCTTFTTPEDPDAPKTKTLTATVKSISGSTVNVTIDSSSYSLNLASVPITHGATTLTVYDLAVNDVLSLIYEGDTLTAVEVK